MPSLTRVLNFNFFKFPPPILSISHHLFVKFHYCVPPHSFKVSRCPNEDCDDFLPWLETKAGVQISEVLSIGNSDFGRSLFACKSIQAGDCLLKVPFNVQISPDNVLPEIKPLLTDAAGTVAKLAIVILVEQKKGQSSEWAPYISRLPQHGELHSTIFWSKKELQMIQQSSVYQETLNHEAQIRKVYMDIRPVFDRFPEIFEDVQYENFKHAYGLVASRAWESTKGESLIPFADFLNHDGTSESVVLCDINEQVSEVLIRYGKFPNSMLLLDFGFTAPCNKYDQVTIQIDIPCNDPLRAMKLDILQKHCLPKAKDANFSPSGASFVIKEVKSSKGKGKGIPQSLRAFARILCCTSSRELNELAVEATRHDGRLARDPLVKRSLEIRAHEILLSLIDELIEKYSVSIKSLHVVESTNCRKFAIRRQMAQDLLAGDVRVLRSASAWLKNYCKSYTDHEKTIVNPLQTQQQS
ncbi:fructose-bisphosphate aldolase-lysine N-methyltransferase, chloroplastic isoform X4 [Spinacia oleracea]|uniref:Fructose-bisphosphate aldolase-lysine N-methyltransferase, chloroplastic isoform X4 n=1 Tax=Spinacia oleracea TaxID=3562 RepID=A0ABM3RBI3_SPIOL|nr:fructose-bisphosphate aldolase-lysine N-methyltransferase, chloroplastic isoform X4 [Spinacia oleracea]